jgi:hypothetical protein
MPAIPALPLCGFRLQADDRGRALGLPPKGGSHKLLIQQLAEGGHDRWRWTRFGTRVFRDEPRGRDNASTLARFREFGPKFSDSHVPPVVASPLLDRQANSDCVDGNDESRGRDGLCARFDWLVDFHRRSRSPRSRASDGTRARVAEVHPPEIRSIAVGHRSVRRRRSVRDDCTASARGQPPL